jgi:hypothetical protein
LASKNQGKTRELFQPFWFSLVLRRWFYFVVLVCRHILLGINPFLVSNVFKKAEV